MYNKLNSNGQK
uniref:Uncharacterized protein n=1 Tax=Rhizophora mucronata TaxID=61149 RepID=A0A2P2PBR0_RHIMU